MAVPTFLQSNTAASDSAAASSHQIATSNPIRSAGGSICPSTITVGIVYDNGTGGIGTSMTGTSGATYTRIINRPSATNGFTLEVWEAHDVPGGSIETVTWNGSASVKAKLGIVEMDQVAPVSPIDGTSTPFDKSTDRVDTTNSSARSSAATNGVRRVGQIECFVGWIGWNDTRTISSAGSTWTGLVQLSGGSSNLGIGIERKLAEVTNVAGGNGIARFTMSASGTQPASVACLAFFRDGVITSNDNDGYLDNIEGVITTYTTDMSAYGGEFLYRSSSSAPLGGTGASNTARTYSYLPRYFKPAAATIGPTFSLSMISAGGFDDASGYVGFYGYVHKTEVFGTTLDSSDDFLTGNYAIYNGVGMTVSGLHTFSGLAYADYINPTGVTTVQWTSEGDTQGTQSNVYTVLGDHTNGTPAYIVLSLTYPSSAVPTRNLLGVGI